MDEEWPTVPLAFSVLPRLRLSPLEQKQRCLMELFMLKGRYIACAKASKVTADSLQKQIYRKFHLQRQYCSEPGIANEKKKKEISKGGSGSMLVDFFPLQKIFSPAIFDFHFRENPHFLNKIQALYV